MIINEYSQYILLLRQRREEIRNSHVDAEDKPLFSTPSLLEKLTCLSFLQP